MGRGSVPGSYMNSIDTGIEKLSWGENFFRPAAGCCLPWGGGSVPGSLQEQYRYGDRIIKPVQQKSGKKTPADRAGPSFAAVYIIIIVFTPHRHLPFRPGRRREAVRKSFGLRLNNSVSVPIQKQKGRAQTRHRVKNIILN